jgi:hypothetical protein
VSAGRRYRRSIGRHAKTTSRPRRPGVELSHETRTWVGRVQADHDDPAVSYETFRRTLAAWLEHVATLPETEYAEAGWQLVEHVASYLAGHPVRALGTLEVER